MIAAAGTDAANQNGEMRHGRAASLGGDGQFNALDHRLLGQDPTDRAIILIVRPLRKGG